MMISKENTLIAVFSYNMGSLLDHCVRSIEKSCPGFEFKVFDDSSDERTTREVIASLQRRGVDVLVNRDPKGDRKHGNLYANIRRACKIAEDSGFRYLFMVQDDMQFLRPLSSEVLSQYSEYLSSNHYHLQVDPRFLMRRPYEFLPETETFRHSGLMSYADVGILDLDKLKNSGWVLKDGERENARGLRELGYLRCFPRTPVMMHVPFPPRYRNGTLKSSLLVPFRGRYRFEPMNADEIRQMDRRPRNVAPVYRSLLRTSAMGIARIPYLILDDRKIFS